jgi:hypothetical protein
MGDVRFVCVRYWKALTNCDVWVRVGVQLQWSLVKFVRSLALLAVAFVAIRATAAWGDPTSKPKIIAFLADDLGAAEVGWRRREIRTPHLDSLAKNGLNSNSSMCNPCAIRHGLLFSLVATHSGADCRWELLLPGLISDFRLKRDSFHRH